MSRFNYLEKGENSVNNLVSRRSVLESFQPRYRVQNKTNFTSIEVLKIFSISLTCNRCFKKLIFFTILKKSQIEIQYLCWRCNLFWRRWSHLSSATN